MNADWYVNVRQGLRLPLRESPIKFAVNMPDGSTSNAWRVWTQGGDAYICCRDNMKEIKVSLHASGKQHIAFHKDAGVEMTPGSRFWNQWHEPPQQNPVVPSFKLLFPPWGVRLTDHDRNKTTAIRRRWDDNQILLEGDEELLVAISFLILDDSTSLQFPLDHPHALIGALPLTDQKSLFVVAGKGSEGDLKSTIERGIARVTQDLAKMLLEIQDKGGSPVACLTGDHPDGFAYMVVVPVRAHVQGNGRAP
ncbi:MAG: hypothetical protein OXI03_05510 [Chloroflexota bacterium]|nr:hypothetical protein [Chloroflexota bacterium]